MQALQWPPCWPAISLPTLGSLTSPHAFLDFFASGSTIHSSQMDLIKPRPHLLCSVLFKPPPSKSSHHTSDESHVLLWDLASRPLASYHSLSAHLTASATLTIFLILEPSLHVPTSRPFFLLFSLREPTIPPLDIILAMPSPLLCFCTESP